jgi:predicted transcriptional regulator
MMLKKLRCDLKWSTNELARRAQIDGSTVRSAEKGFLISISSAQAIADALSKAHGREIQQSELQLRINSGSAPRENNIRSVVLLNE